MAETAAVSELTLDEKIALAVSASAVPVENLDTFCDERGLPMEQVTSWSTAYDTGGALGVRALLTQWQPPRAQVKTWKEELKSAMKAFRPRRLRSRTEGNWVTVDEVKELTVSSIVHTPVFQLRVVEDGEGERWFLYWRRASGTWWPYAGRPSFPSIADAVQEVVSDPHCCFRMHPIG